MHELAMHEMTREQDQDVCYFATVERTSPLAELFTVPGRILASVDLAPRQS
jgi:hypothetical protein